MTVAVVQVRPVLVRVRRYWMPVKVRMRLSLFSVVMVVVRVGMAVLVGMLCFRMLVLVAVLF